MLGIYFTCIHGKDFMCLENQVFRALTKLDFQLNVNQGTASKLFGIREKLLILQTVIHYKSLASSMLS